VLRGLEKIAELEKKKAATAELPIASPSVRVDRKAGSRRVHPGCRDMDLLSAESRVRWSRKGSGSWPTTRACC